MKETNMEVWKDIEGYEGLYEISNLGRVKCLERLVKNKNGYRKVKERILTTTSFNYACVFLSNSSVKQHYVHRLVATAFIPNPLNKEMVNHKSGNKLDNRLNNLEWVTRSENQIHAFSIGLCEKTRTKSRERMKLINLNGQNKRK